MSETSQNGEIKDMGGVNMLAEAVRGDHNYFQGEINLIKKRLAIIEGAREDFPDTDEPAKITSNLPTFETICKKNSSPSSHFYQGAPPSYGMQPVYMPTSQPPPSYVPGHSSFTPHAASSAPGSFTPDSLNHHSGRSLFENDTTTNFGGSGGLFQSHNSAGILLGNDSVLEEELDSSRQPAMYNASTDFRYLEQP